MAEGRETPGLDPEAYQAAEGITPETAAAREVGALDSVEELEGHLADRAERELPNAPRPPEDPVAAQLAELNRVAREKLGFEDSEELTEDDLERTEHDAEASKDIDAMMPREGGMHQPVGFTATERAPEPTDARVEFARREAMQQEITEGVQRYAGAMSDAADRLLLKPRSDTVKERWDQLTLENKRGLELVVAAARTQFIDPVVIRAKFDRACERILRFAEDADRG